MAIGTISSGQIAKPTCYLNILTPPKQIDVTLPLCGTRGMGAEQDHPFGIIGINETLQYRFDIAQHRDTQTPLSAIEGRSSPAIFGW